MTRRLHSLMMSVLSSRFGPEWDVLPPDSRVLVLKDFAIVLRDEYDVPDYGTMDDGVALDNAQEASRVYRRRIGGGNLASYAATLAAGK
jgi:hypothetical protein